MRQIAASVRHDTNATLTNRHALSSLRMMHVGRCCQPTRHVTRCAPRSRASAVVRDASLSTCIRVCEAAAETSPASLAITHAPPIDDRFRVAGNYGPGHHPATPPSVQPDPPSSLVARGWTTVSHIQRSLRAGEILRLDGGNTGICEK